MDKLNCLIVHWSPNSYITKEMLDIKRKHWKIEYGLHYVLDDALREDRSPAKKVKTTLLC